MHDGPLHTQMSTVLAKATKAVTMVKQGKEEKEIIDFLETIPDNTTVEEVVYTFVKCTENNLRFMHLIASNGHTRVWRYLCNIRQVEVRADSLSGGGVLKKKSKLNQEWTLLSHCLSYCGSSFEILVDVIHRYQRQTSNHRFNKLIHPQARM